MLLSPFDNLLCDRARTEQLFGFTHRLEIYTPKAKRRWGYFVLPVLDGDRLVARADLAIDRKTNTLVALAVHAEPNVPRGKRLPQAIRRELERLAAWRGATRDSRCARHPPPGGQSWLPSRSFSSPVHEPPTRLAGLFIEGVKTWMVEWVAPPARRRSDCAARRGARARRAGLLGLGGELAQAGTNAGTLHGKVVNDTGRAKRAKIVVPLHRRGTKRAVVGRTTVKRRRARRAPATASRSRCPSASRAATTTCRPALRRRAPAARLRHRAARGRHRRRVQGATSRPPQDDRPAAPAAARCPSPACACTRRRATPATRASTPTSTWSTTRRRTCSCRARTSTSSSARRSA